MEHCHEFWSFGFALCSFRQSLWNPETTPGPEGLGEGRSAAARLELPAGEHRGDAQLWAAGAAPVLRGQAQAQPLHHRGDKPLTHLSARRAAALTADHGREEGS